MTEAVQSAIDAFALGAIYGVLALGVAVVSGVMRLINFAYGELLLASGYVLLATATSLPFALAGASVLVAGIVLSMTMERVAFRPFRGAAPETMLIASFAVSVFLQNLALATIGSRPKGIELPAFFSESVTVFGVRLAVINLIALGACGLSLLAASLILNRTVTGIRMRAAAEDFRMARLLGVRANRVLLSAFALSGALAGVAALVIFGKSGVIAPNSGISPAIIAIVAVVVGGADRLPGAVLGGVVLGVASSLLQTLLPGSLVPFREAFLFGTVIVILLIRPGGLLSGHGSTVRP